MKEIFSNIPAMLMSALLIYVVVFFMTLSRQLRRDRERSAMRFVIIIVDDGQISMKGTAPTEADARKAVASIVPAYTGKNAESLADGYSEDGLTWKGELERGDDGRTVQVLMVALRTEGV